MSNYCIILLTGAEGEQLLSSFLFMDMLCSICDIKIFKGYFCSKCYKKYKDDILGGEVWVKYCKNLEQIRRRKVARDPPMIYLGNEWDIDDKNNLVYRD